VGQTSTPAAGLQTAIFLSGNIRQILFLPDRFLEHFPLLGGSAEGAISSKGEKQDMSNHLKNVNPRNESHSYPVHHVPPSRAGITACAPFIPIVLALCIATTASAQTVPLPNFSVHNTGFYCSVTWPNAGGSYAVLNPGDIDKSPCSFFPGSTVKRVGLYTTDNWNIAESWCAPNYYWIYELWGGPAAINSVVYDASEELDARMRSSRLVITGFNNLT
jgi:hypothetical protein